MPQRRGPPVWWFLATMYRWHWLLPAALLAFPFGVPTCVGGDDSGASPASAATTGLVGARVNVELKSGKTLKDVTIDDVRSGKVAGTVARLRVTDAGTNAKTILGALAVARVTAVDGKVLLVFDAPSKALAPPDAAQLAAIHRAAAAVAAAKPSGDAASPPRAARAAKDRAAKSKRGQEADVDDDAVRKENEAKRLELFKKTGVWMWPEVTAKEQEENLAKQKEFLRQVAKKFAPLHMQVYETRHFLFLSDLPPQWVEVFTSCLDAMHNQLCAAYGIKDKDRVWLGKLPVIAFSGSSSFEECEKTFFQHPVDGGAIQGLAHNSSSGEVVVTCHCGKDPYYFAAVLVHETTHGFNHRYKSGVRLPSWLDEGIADWVAMMVVKKNTAVVRKVQIGLTQARQQGNLGSNFFGDGKIERWQYGVAASMVDFLLKSNGKSFRKMLDSIKQGTKWRDALKDAYGVTPADLTAAFGKTVGIPNLQP